MTKISATWTLYYKRILPAIWLAILTLWTAIMLGIGRSGEALVQSGSMMIALPIAMAVVALVIARKVLWSCADEVFDRGDSLLVRRGGREVEIPIEDIESVRSLVLVRPHRVTLRLARPSALGSEITFIPERDGHNLPFAKSRIAIELGRRVEQARE